MEQETPDDDAIKFESDERAPFISFVERKIAEHEISDLQIIVLDCLWRIHPIDEMRVRKMVQTLNELRTVAARHNVAIVFVSRYTGVLLVLFENGYHIPVVECRRSYDAVL